MKTLPDIKSLSYACIDAKPIDYEFSGDNNSDYTEDGCGWRVCEGSLLPDDFETEITVGNEILTLDRDDFQIEVTDAEGDSVLFDPNEGNVYDDYAKYFGLDVDAVRRAIDGEDHEDWEPMMNYAYPLDREPSDDWKTLVNNCTLVEIDGNYYLALTGGGMDFSWEICESYMRLGYLPPAHFASSLPRMAGRGTSDLDRWIVAGCRASLEGMRDRAADAIERLNDVSWG